MPQCRGERDGLVRRADQHTSSDPIANVWDNGGGSNAIKSRCSRVGATLTAPKTALTGSGVPAAQQLRGTAITLGAVQKTVPSDSGQAGQRALGVPTARMPSVRARLDASGAASESVPAPAWDMQPAFAWQTRVYYEDTDAGGVVYYANYLRFLERCRTEWMRALGFGQRDLAQRDGVLFVVAGAELQFLRSAILDDELTVGARLVERRASYVVFEQQAMRGSELLCRAKVKVACIDARTKKPTRLPAALASALAGAVRPRAVPVD